MDAEKALAEAKEVTRRVALVAGQQGYISDEELSECDEAISTLARAAFEAGRIYGEDRPTCQPFGRMPLPKWLTETSR